MTTWLALLGCTADEETSYDQYNDADESVVISVGTAEFLPAVSVALHSSTGAVEVGLGSVDPGGGPVGTVHTVLVEVFDEYASSVSRASVRLDSGERGVDEYDLDADSAGEGIWVLELESVGESDESREDTLTFRLWSEVVEEDDGG